MSKFIGVESIEIHLKKETSRSMESLIFLIEQTNFGKYSRIFQPKNACIPIKIRVNFVSPHLWYKSHTTVGRERVKEERKRKRKKRETKI